MSGPPIAQPEGRASPAWLLLFAGIVFSLLSTKAAGALWLGLCVAGVAVAWKARGRPVAVPAAPAARAWLAGCLAAAVLAVGVYLVWWPLPFDQLNAELRLALAAGATLPLLRCSTPLARRRQVAAFAAAAACAVAMAHAAALTWFMGSDARDHLPANALPWSLAVAFALCMLAPLLLAGRSRRGTAWYAFATMAGLLAIALSQSRAAMLVFPWIVAVVGHAAWADRRRAARVRVWVALATATALVAGAVAAVHPADPLRLRRAERELQLAEVDNYFNSSLGARVYLWHLGWQGVKESPWIGVGPQERFRRIKQAGVGGTAREFESLGHVRAMGHVHNQYLHSALDGGLLGLGSVLALIAGLGVAAWRLRRIDRIASLQLGGILLMHTVAGFSNVNLGHNFYAVALSIFVTLVLLCAGPAHGRAASA